MTEDADIPQIYLISPSEVDLLTYPDILAACLDAVPVACMRLALGTRDPARLARTADALRVVTHARDVALVIDTHVGLVVPHGLDGVHLTDAARSVRAARKELGDDAIVGTHCAASRHDGMTAGEMGADYVAFGPVGTTPLGDTAAAAPELFEWWSQMIEVPVIAEGGLTEETVRQFAPVVDFFGFGEELWRDEAPAQALASLAAAAR